uniref:Uncharacterized protein n=1 Tax=Heterorhabditis bacteriophora TaxID=37862 RepID=A0A1I7WHA8_HETBA
MLFKIILDLTNCFDRNVTDLLLYILLMNKI